MDLREAIKVLKSSALIPSLYCEGIKTLVDFTTDYLTHRIPLRVAPHQLGDFAMEWFIQDKDGRTMLPNTPDCGNVHKLFRDMEEDKPNYHWSYNPRMTQEERKEMR